MLQRLRNWVVRAAGRTHAGAASALPPDTDARSMVPRGAAQPTRFEPRAATPRQPADETVSNQHRAAVEIALRTAPDDAQLNFRMGLIHLAEGDAAAALDYLHLALHYAPGLFPACAARARALAMLGRGAAQADAYREFLRANAGHQNATYALALWHHAHGEHEAAVELLRPLANQHLVNRDACNLLGLILGRELGRFDEGERFLRQALEPDPQWHVALSNLGWVLLEKGDYQRGSELLDAALARDPEDHETRLMRAYTDLKRGEFDRGWRDFEARHHSGLALHRPYRFARWDGTPIKDKTLLIYGEQGLGDQIMFASCFGEAIERAGRCIIECDPQLVKLYARSFPSALVQAQTAADAEPAWLAQTGPIERQIPMGSLPGFWRRRWEDFPRHAGYLRATPERIAYWRARLDELGPGPKIGLSWRGGVAATRRHQRSIALAQFLPLLRLPARFISLQYGQCAFDLDALRREHGVTLPHWQDALDDYNETAALVCALDLVVSVCTAIIHLAGALGKPVWILVPAIAEWRYLDRGRRLPWYPSALMFRQTAPGKWQDVIGDVVEQVGQFPRAGALWIK